MTITATYSTLDLTRITMSKITTTWLPLLAGLCWTLGSCGALLADSGVSISEAGHERVSNNIQKRPDIRPNIILCMADDQGWGDVGFNGHPFLKTPHLDRLAGEGLKFNRWYAAAPVCSPTRGSCLTGRHPFRYGIYTANKGHLKSEEIGLQEILKAQGYATGHFGKWHLGTLTTQVDDANRGKPGNEKDYSPPWEHGFDVCFSTESKVPTFDPMKNPNKVSQASKKGVEEGGPYGTAYWRGPEQRVPDQELEGDDSMLIAKQATKFMQESAHQGKPFFAVVWFHAPHLPVVADQAHRDLYPDHPHGLYGQHYAGCISAIDDAVGHLDAELQRIGVKDNTMLWYCADNGPESSAEKGAGSAGPFRGRKRSLYEGGVRVPAFLVWPTKIAAASETDFPCVTSDYLPTILDSLKLKLPDRPLDGISLMPLVQGKLKQRRKPIGFQSAGVATWNAGQYKLVRSSKRTGQKKSSGLPKIELYDLLQDPAESNDLAADKPELSKTMNQALSAWQESCKNSDQGQDY
ncbi:MAG: arylsulfatase A-like enzyme [Mariniblastus sp.]|jgi:arylsulfatase A-like enzyme